MKNTTLKILCSRRFVVLKNIFLLIIILLFGTGSDSFEIMMTMVHNGKLENFMILLGLVYAGAFTGILEFSYENTDFNSLFELSMGHIISAMLNFATGVMTMFIFLYLKALLGSTMFLLLVSVALLYFSIILYEVWNFHKARRNFFKNIEI